MLLRFSKHEMMNVAPYVVLCAEVTYKEYFSYSNKVKNKI